MKLHLPLFAAPVFVAFLFPPARAAFNPAIVAGDAQWVVSLDLNELRQTVLGKELLDMAQKQMPPPSATGNLRLDFSKLLTTVGTATAYGTNFVPDPMRLDGALLLQGTAELRKILEGFVAQATITTPEFVAEEKGLPFEAYRVGGEVLIGFPAEPIVLVSKSKTQLVKAHDVFRGAVPSLAKTPASPLQALVARSERSYVTVASVVPTDLGAMPDGPQTRILQLMNAGAVMLGETNERTTAHLKLVASSDATASKLQKIVEGMTAMLSLAESTDRQLAEFLQSTSVARNDRIVTLDFAYSSERLAEMIRTLQQGGREAARRANAAANTPPPVETKTLAEWPLEGAPAEAAPGERTFASRKIENIRLVTGATLTLNGRREGNIAPGNTARFDSVEITPAAGGAPLRFEAENMKLSRYGVIPAPTASGSRLIALMSPAGTARFEFPGAEGDYTITVRYVEENDAKTQLSITLREPAPVPATK